MLRITFVVLMIAGLIMPMASLAVAQDLPPIKVYKAPG
jgi:K+-transporting ATPase c subunit